MEHETKPRRKNKDNGTIKERQREAKKSFETNLLTSCYDALAQDCANLDTNRVDRKRTLEMDPRVTSCSGSGSASVTNSRSSKSSAEDLRLLPNSEFKLDSAGTQRVNMPTNSTTFLSPYESSSNSTSKCRVDVAVKPQTQDLHTLLQNSKYPPEDPPQDSSKKLKSKSNNSSILNSKNIRRLTHQELLAASRRALQQHLQHQLLQNQLNQALSTAEQQQHLRPQEAQSANEQFICNDALHQLASVAASATSSIDLMASKVGESRVPGTVHAKTQRRYSAPPQILTSESMQNTNVSSVTRSKTSESSSYDSKLGRTFMRYSRIDSSLEEGGLTTSSNGMSSDHSDDQKHCSVARRHKGESPPKKEGMRGYPCLATGWPADHEVCMSCSILYLDNNSWIVHLTVFFSSCSQNARLYVRDDTRHGEDLVCSYAACRDSGTHAVYCRVCERPVLTSVFASQHSHPELMQIGKHLAPDFVTNSTARGSPDYNSQNMENSSRSDNRNKGFASEGSNSSGGGDSNRSHKMFATLSSLSSSENNKNNKFNGLLDTNKKRNCSAPEIAMNDAGNESGKKNSDACASSNDNVSSISSSENGGGSENSGCGDSSAGEIDHGSGEEDNQKFQRLPAREHASKRRHDDENASPRHHANVKRARIHENASKKRGSYSSINSSCTSSSGGTQSKSSTMAVCSATKRQSKDHKQENRLRWQRMLLERPPSTDVSGITQWLLSLFDLATESAILKAEMGGGDGDSYEEEQDADDEGDYQSEDAEKGKSNEQFHSVVVKKWDSRSHEQRHLKKHMKQMQSQTKKL